jgi:hypothetical protein
MRPQSYIRAGFKEATPKALKIMTVVVKKGIVEELAKLQKKGAAAFKKAGKA